MNVDITFSDAIIREVKGRRIGVLESSEDGGKFLNALLNCSIVTEIVAAAATQTDRKAGGEEVKLCPSSNGYPRLVQLFSNWIDDEETVEVAIAYLHSQVIEETFGGFDSQLHGVLTER